MAERKGKKRTKIERERETGVLVVVYIVDGNKQGWPSKTSSSFYILDLQIFFPSLPCLFDIFYNDFMILLILCHRMKILLFVVKSRALMNYCLEYYIV